MDGIGTHAGGSAGAVLAPRLCRHCGRKSVNRPRGLCWNCYYTPAVAVLYPSTSKYARRGLGGGNVTPGPPAAPTAAAPGSAEKVAVMEARARAGRDLWHDADARWDGDDRPTEWLKGRTG